MKRVFTLLFVLMALGTTSWAQTLYVGGKKVDLNATTTQTITGSGIEGKVTYSPSSKTLYLEGATIRGSIYGSDLGSSASTRYFIYLKGANNLITSDRGIRFDNSYVVLYGADGSDGASLTINSENSNSGFSCISTEGGHFEVWSVKLNMIGASKGFYGTPSSATLSFVNSMVQIDCNAGAIYGYKNVYFDDCKVTTRDVKFQSGKGYVDSAGDLVSALNVWPLLCVGGEPVRTASDSRTGTKYSWTWTKSTKTLELTGGFNTKAYPAIANYGIEGLTVKVNDGCAIQSTNTAINIEANTKFEGNGKLSIYSTSGNAIVARADVCVCMKELNAVGKKYGFTDEQSGHELTLDWYSASCVYSFCGETRGDIYSSNLSLSRVDISNDNTYWNPKDGYVYVNNSIKKGTITSSSSYTTFKSYDQLRFYGFYVGELQVRQNCADYIMPPGLTSGTIKYNPSSNTLTLTDVTLTNATGISGTGIKIRDNNGLTINVVGNNTFAVRQSVIDSYKSFSITGSGSFTGTSTDYFGFLLNNGITCTVSGPKLDITAVTALQDWMNNATLDVKGSTTQISLQNDGQLGYVAIDGLSNLKLADGLAIVEPAGGYFSSSLKTITTNGTSAYQGKVVIGKPINYGMYIGETRVTSANAADILGDGQFRYDPSTKTLTVTNANLTNDGALGGGIDNREIDGLTINFVGNSTITTRNDAVYSEKSFNIIGDGSLIGTANSGYGFYMAGDYITCTIDGPQLEFTGAYGLSDYTGTATLYVKGSSTRLTLYSNSYNEAILNLGSLLLGDNIDIVEPAGGYFDSSLKSITTDGNSTYKGKVVFGYATMVRGDVNLDGQVDIADAVTVLNAMAGQPVAGDANVNGDDSVDIADFVTVLNIMAGQ